MLVHNYVNAANRKYYVNDNVTNNDVWCTTNGNDARSGTNAGEPKLTIGNLISTYSLSNGDTVYIDTGTYNERLIIGTNDHGGLNQYLNFVGSGVSNQTSLITGTPGVYIVYLDNTKWIKFIGFKLASASTALWGFYSDNCTNIYIANNRIISNTRGGLRFNSSPHGTFISNDIKYNVALGIDTYGIVMNNSSSNLIQGNICRFNGNESIVLENGSHFNLVKDNICRQNNRATGGNGIRARGSTTYSNYYIHNDCSSNLSVGIVMLENTHNNLIKSNICYDNVNAQIYNLLSYSNIIKNNYCRKGAWGALVITRSHHLIIDNNQCYKSTISATVAGVKIETNCKSLMIKNNICDSNSNGIMAQYWSSGTLTNLSQSTLFNNYCNFNNNDSGISLNKVFYCTIKSNKCYNNFGGGGYGLNLMNCTNNIVSYNECYKNTGTGIRMYPVNNIFISYNKCFSNSYGMYLLNTTSCTTYRSAFYQNNWAGIQFDNVDNCMIKNCTIYSGRGYGIAMNNDSDNNIVRNTIIANNGIALNASGINIPAGCDNTILRYNDVFGNRTSITNSNTTDGGGNYQGCSAGIGDLSPSLDPVFVKRYYTDPNFLHLSNMSSCIDMGDPADNSDPTRQGNRIDIGAYESPYSVTMTLSKVASITLGGNLNISIPGATITYSISYTNKGTGAGYNLVISDALSVYVQYKPNSITTNQIHPGGKVIVECYDGSTWQNLTWANSNPEQVEQIRWRIYPQTPIAPQDYGIFSFQVYIE